MIKCNLSLKMKKITKEQVYNQLKTVIDPELHIDIVSMGLIYDVSIGSIQMPSGEEKIKVHILMTLTTPGCPLIGVLNHMIKEAVTLLPGINDNDIDIELTFDPPWIPDMMSEEVRAELGV